MTGRSAAANAGLSPLRRALGSPLLLVFMPILVSALAWAAPESWYGRYWSASWSAFRASDWLAYLAILAFLLVMAIAGSFVGSLLRPQYRAMPADFGKAFRIWYLVVSATAALGTASVYVRFVQAFGVSYMLGTVSRGDANVLKEFLYSDYQVGLASLRYVSSLAGGVALYLILIRRQAILLSLANIAVLLLSAFVSMRLSLITALLVFFLLLVRSGVKIGKLRLAALGVLVLVLLVFANQSRNINYYREIGLSGPLQATFAEAMTYVASPTQGALATSRAMIAGNPSPEPGISAELTTNSALLEVYLEQGAFGVFRLGITLCLFSALYLVVFRGGDPALVAGAGAWGYAFLEVWRVHLFYRGIFIVYFAFGFLAPLLIGMLWREGSRASAPAARGPQPEGRPWRS